MNIPRQFYGVNYLSKIVSNYQDKETTYFPKTEYNNLNDSDNIPLDKADSYRLSLNAGETYNFLKKLMSDRSCGVDGIAIARGEDVLLSFYRPPYSVTTPHITNSTCKTVTAIAVMFALSEERIGLSDKVVSYFEDYESKAIPQAVREITIEHLLNMTSCSKTNELISVCEEDWVKAFLLTDCSKEPGSCFIYNSMNTYMLAAILRRVTGESLMDYLTPRLWKPLGISGIKWELCPKGIERGGWGLHITLDGMLKLGMFLANDGSFHGRQLIHPSFIRMMKSNTVMQDTDKLSASYGYQLWNLPDGAYMLSGMYGQHVIINEKKKLIVSVNAHSDKMFPDSKLTRSILAFINNEKLYVPDFVIREKLNYGKLIKLIKYYSTDDTAPNEAERIRRYAGKLNNKNLIIENGSVKLFPYLMQSLYMYPPYHINVMEIKLIDDDRIGIIYNKTKTKKNETECLEFEYGIGKYHHKMMSFGEDVRPVACRAYMAKDEDGRNVLMLDMTFPDAGYSRVIKLFFLDDNKLALECVEYPDIKAIVDQVLSGETVLAGNAVDLADRLPEGVRVMLDQQMEPRMNIKVL